MLLAGSSWPAGARPGTSLTSLRPGTGSAPLRSRSRTSLAVDGETPAARAISRREAFGWFLITSCAFSRPSAGLTGRTRPSRPIRAVL